MNTTFDQVLRAAQQLTPEEQAVLIAHLQSGSTTSSSERGALLRQRLRMAFERRQAAGAFDNLESLKGKYARPGTPADADKVESYLRSLSSEWEEDLDDLAN